MGGQRVRAREGLISSFPPKITNVFSRQARSRGDIVEASDDSGPKALKIYTSIRCDYPNVLSHAAPPLCHAYPLDVRPSVRVRPYFPHKIEVATLVFRVDHDLQFYIPTIPTNARRHQCFYNRGLICGRRGRGDEPTQISHVLHI